MSVMQENKELAPQYNEQKRRYRDVDKLDLTTLPSKESTGHDALRVKFGPNQTVGGINIQYAPAYIEDIPAVKFGNFMDTYVLADDKSLYLVDRDSNKLRKLSAGGVRRVTGIDFPEPAVVTGTPQNDVECDVYYTSNYTGDVLCKTLYVCDVTGGGDEIHVAGFDDDDVSHHYRTNERRRLERRGKNNRCLGKVRRVEFPHR